MPRIKLSALDRYAFRWEYTIGVRDLNYGGHLANDALAGILQEARVRALDELGYTELNLGDGQTATIMGDSVINFLGEGHLLNTLSIETHFAELRARNLRCFHRVSGPQGPVALAEAGIIGFNYGTRKVVAFPVAFLEKLQKL